jgi:hypothetical protein
MPDGIISLRVGFASLLFAALAARACSVAAFGTGASPVGAEAGPAFAEAFAVLDDAVVAFPALFFLRRFACTCVLIL